MKKLLILACLVVVVLPKGPPIHRSNAPKFQEQALALPAISFNELDEEDIKRIRQVRELHDFIKKHYPGAEIWIGPEAPEPGYERTPITWNNKQVWIKRAPISDRRFS